MIEIKINEQCARYIDAADLKGGDIFRHRNQEKFFQVGEELHGDDKIALCFGNGKYYSIGVGDVELFFGKLELIPR